MYVCLCLGVTSHTVSDAVAAGAVTANAVAAACGAGAECGRCRKSVRAIIDGACAGPGQLDQVRRGRTPK